MTIVEGDNRNLSDVETRSKNELTRERISLMDELEKKAREIGKFFLVNDFGAGGQREKRVIILPHPVITNNGAASDLQNKVLIVITQNGIRTAPFPASARDTNPFGRLLRDFAKKEPCELHVAIEEQDNQLEINVPTHSSRLEDQKFFVPLSKEEVSEGLLIEALDINLSQQLGKFKAHQERMKAMRDNKIIISKAIKVLGKPMA